MWRTFRVTVLTAVACSVATLCAAGDPQKEAKGTIEGKVKKAVDDQKNESKGGVQDKAKKTSDDQKTEIKGGIEGKVRKVDVEGKKLTITTTQGRERTFTITDDTTMVGPNGGKVRKELKDPRFREGFPVTVVPDGNAADEVHLGFAKDAAGADTAKTKDASKLEEEDDEDEIPGHVKSFDAEKRILIVTLLNGKNRSFILAQDVPVHVKGSTAASKQGLKDPQLKAGALVTVVTDEGGRKVKELKITPASQAKKKKAA